MSETETGALARAMATQLFYLRAIFVAIMSVMVLAITIAVTPTGAGTVTVVGAATTSPTAASCTGGPGMCITTSGSGAINDGSGSPDLTVSSGGAGAINDSINGGGGNGTVYSGKSLPVTR